jgi:membrane protease YdiL (CAAX protease family)
MICIGALMEEYVFRGLFPKLIPDVSLMLLGTISVSTWAMTHLLVGGWVHVLLVLPSGIIYFLIRVYFGSWLKAAITHITANIVAILLLVMGFA